MQNFMALAFVDIEDILMGQKSKTKKTCTKVSFGSKLLGKKQLEFRVFYFYKDFFALYFD